MALIQNTGCYVCISQELPLNSVSSKTSRSAYFFFKINWAIEEITCKFIALIIIAIFPSNVWVSLPADFLRCYECLGSAENCSEDEMSTNSGKQIVCGSVEDRCILVYSRDGNLEQFNMNCSRRDTCKEAVESCHETMKTNKLQCCDVTCCDSDFCNKLEYSGLWAIGMTVILLQSILIC